jgi:hypothetical protein
MYTKVLIKTASWNPNLRKKSVWKWFRIVYDERLWCYDDQFGSSGVEGEMMRAEASKQRLGVCN